MILHVLRVSAKLNFLDSNFNTKGRFTFFNYFQALDGGVEYQKNYYNEIVLSSTLKFIYSIFKSVLFLLN